MIQRAGGPPFGDEAALALGVGRGLGMQQLDGNVALETRIPGLEYLPHAAGADSRDDAIRSDSIA